MTAHKHLIEAYKFHRNRGQTAFGALHDARLDVATGKRRYTSQFAWQANNINPPHAGYGHKRLRWIEEPVVWRFSGTSHDIAKELSCYPRAYATGWYTRHADYVETTSGVVYQLPARKGVPQYVAGYSDPTGNGACVSIDQLFDDKMDAARAANRLAELFAEESREYDEAWQAGNHYADLARNVATLRREALELIQEAKQAAGTMRNAYPALYSAIRASIQGMLAEIQELREKRAKLLDEFGRHKGFAEGQE
jgi:hypothetical protein